MTQDNQVVSKPALAALALVSWAGVLLQLWLSINLALANDKTAGDGLVAYLGYFTVLTNLFVALTATLPLIAGSSRLGRWFGKPMVLGCATTAIVLVGIVYHLLLRNVWAPQGFQLLADNVLHYAVPIATLAYWIVYPPRAKLSLLAPLVWCLYPVCYLVYVLIRGAVLGSYPYHFIDVASLGYRQTLINGLGLLAAFLAVGAVVVAIARVRAGRL
jgi:hypothetical protein